MSAGTSHGVVAAGGVVAAPPKLEESLAMGRAQSAVPGGSICEGRGQAATPGCLFWSLREALQLSQPSPTSQTALGPQARELRSAHCRLSFHQQRLSFVESPKKEVNGKRSPKLTTGCQFASTMQSFKISALTYFQSIIPKSQACLEKRKAWPQTHS